MVDLYSRFYFLLKESNKYEFEFPGRVLVPITLGGEKKQQLQKKINSLNLYYVRYIAELRVRLCVCDV